MKTRILLVFILILTLISCDRTVNTIKIHKEKELPIEFIYSSQEKKIFRVVFYFSYSLINTSQVSRNLVNTYYISGNKKQTNAIYNSIRDKEIIKPIIKRGNSVRIVTRRRALTKIDTLIRLRDLNIVPDTVYLHGCDTIKRYSYKTIAELQKELPEFLEMYIKKTDSIRFEFDDSELPFYVKRSRYKETLGGKTFEGELEHPWITVSVLGD